MTKEDFFIDSNRQPDREQISHEGPYRIVVNSYATRAGGWNYTRCEVYRGEEKVADVKRNYSSFPYAVVLGHPSGHDYLLCGENYQGQTVVELDTGKRADYLPPEAGKGHGFCMAGFHPNPLKTHVLVSGCYWACPYEYRVYDLSDPLHLPWKMLVRAEDTTDMDETLPEFVPWSADGMLFRDWQLLLDDGTDYFSLPPGDRDGKKVIHRFTPVRVMPDGSVHRLDANGGKVGD